MGRSNRKIVAIALGALLALIAFYFAPKKSGSGNTESIPVSATVTGNSAANAVPETKKAAQVSATTALPLEARAEVERCLGSPASDMTEFAALVHARSKERGEAIVEWRNVHFEDNGKKFRLRLSREASESGNSFLELKLFAVDASGLPDKIDIPAEHQRNPSEAILRSYTEGKRVTEIQEAEVVPLDSGELRIESVNGNPLELEWESEQLHVACSTKYSPTCKCFSR